MNTKLCPKCGKPYRAKRALTSGKYEGKTQYIHMDKPGGGFRHCFIKDGDK